VTDDDGTEACDSFELDAQKTTIEVAPAPVPSLAQGNTVTLRSPSPDSDGGLTLRPSTGPIGHRSSSATIYPLTRR